MTLLDSDMEVRFLFVGEGSSDTALRLPLEDLCLQCGADEASGVAPDLRRYQSKSLSVPDKVRKALHLEPDVDLIFVHRDADQEDPTPRHSEIQEALSQIDTSKPWVPVVPIQATEAWALVDEDAIRRAADNPNGTVSLTVPRPTDVAAIADPKERLFDLMVKASEYSGRRLKKFRARIHKKRYFLLEKLDISGPLSKVPAWQNLADRLSEAISAISGRDT
jgi:hypothetical protein